MSIEYLNLRNRNYEIVNLFFLNSKIGNLEFSESSKKILLIQKTFRGFKTRKYIQYLVMNAVKIQKIFRGFLGRRRYRSEKNKVKQFFQKNFFDAAATKIQACFRGFLSRRVNCWQILNEKKNVQNLFARKKFIQTCQDNGIKLLNEASQYNNYLTQSQFAQLQNKKKQFFDQTARNIHHLISTKSINGIFNGSMGRTNLISFNNNNHANNNNSLDSKSESLEISIEARSQSLPTGSHSPSLPFLSNSFTLPADQLNGNVTVNVNPSSSKEKAKSVSEIPVDELIKQAFHENYHSRKSKLKKANPSKSNGNENRNWNKDEDGKSLSSSFEKTINIVKNVTVNNQSLGTTPIKLSLHSIQTQNNDNLSTPLIPIPLPIQQEATSSVPVPASVTAPAPTVSSSGSSYSYYSTYTTNNINELKEEPIASEDKGNKGEEAELNIWKNLSQGRSLPLIQKHNSTSISQLTNLTRSAAGTGTVMIAMSPNSNEAGSSVGTSGSERKDRLPALAHSKC